VISISSEGAPGSDSGAGKVLSVGVCGVNLMISIEIIYAIDQADVEITAGWPELAGRFFAS
jgi:hypothetical protein